VLDQKEMVTNRIDLRRKKKIVTSVGEDMISSNWNAS